MAIIYQTIEKYSGLLAFLLLFGQIIVGRYIKKNWPYYVLTFLLIGTILVHVAAYVYFIKTIKGLFDPFYPFTDLCVLCHKYIFSEYWINFGRLALWASGIGFLSLFFNKKFIWLNYLAFFFLALHAWFLGGNIKTFPLNYLFWGMVGTILGTILLSFANFRRSRKP